MRLRSQMDICQVMKTCLAIMVHMNELIIGIRAIQKELPKVLERLGALEEKQPSSTL